MFGWRLEPPINMLAILIVGFVFSSEGMAQNIELQRTPGALAMGVNSGFVIAFPVVENRPYRALVITQDVSIGFGGKKTLHEALNIHVRDSVGRLRDERPALPPDREGTSSIDTMHVIDPVSMRDVQWDSETKTAIIEAIPEAFALNVEHGREDSMKLATPCDAKEKEEEADYESLGNTDIEGIAVVGCRITVTRPGGPGSNKEQTIVTEIWASPKLQITLLESVHYSNGIETSTKLKDIVLDEPDPALFQVPDGYAGTLIEPVCTSGSCDAQLHESQWTR